MSSETLSLEQTASFLDVNEATIKRWMKEKLLNPTNSDEESPEFDADAVKRYKEINERLRRM